ncbi:MAG: hypothetical protein LH615_16160 [Ferruginibacter sp.]|nr:hypothetical protein [Ferruginibacter sp.]
MGKLIFILFTFTTFSTNLYSQVEIPNEYSKNIKIADSLYKQKKYCIAAKFYNKAFINKNNLSIDFHRIQSGLAWANCREKDSALAQIYIVVYAMNFYDFEFLEKTFSQTILAENREFKNLILRSKCQKLKNIKPYDSSISKILDSIYYLDQAGRSLPPIKKKGTYENDSILNLKYINIIDSLHKIHGWLSLSQVGYNGLLIQFLVIQHSTLSIQKERLPLIKKAVNDCLLAPENYCLLKDRIFVKEKKMQLYGTQYFFDNKTKKNIPFPIRDKKNVNKLRSKMGMVSLEAYYENTTL